MRSFVTFVFFCSSLICTELDRPWDAVSGRQLNVRLIFEQKGTKETKDDPIPFSFVVSRSLALPPSIGLNASSKNQKDEWWTILGHSPDLADALIQGREGATQFCL